MALHNKFLDSYTHALKKGVESDIFDNYLSEDKPQIDQYKIATLNLPFGNPDYKTLCTKMIEAINKEGQHCFEAARLLYEAYEGLPPIVAADESFWAYLCHTEFWELVRKEWPIKDSTNISNHVLDHYFVGKHGLMRNALASLWWSVKVSVIDVPNGDKYELTRIMFRNYSLRTTWLKTQFRIKNSLHGILEFLKDNPDVMEEREEARYKAIAKYINLLGSTRQISVMSKEEIKDELEKIKDKILSAVIEKGKKNNIDAEDSDDEELPAYEN